MDFKEIDKQVDQWIMEGKTKIKYDMEAKYYRMRVFQLYTRGIMLMESIYGFDEFHNHNQRK